MKKLFRNLNWHIEIGDSRKNSQRIVYNCFGYNMNDLKGFIKNKKIKYPSI